VALAFQSVDDIHSGDSLPLGVLSVGDGITDHVLKEHFQDTTSLLVDEARDTLDSTTASETTDSWLGDTLDVITQDFAMTLGATLAESLASFSTSRLCCFVACCCLRTDGDRPELPSHWLNSYKSCRLCRACRRAGQDRGHDMRLMTR